MLNIFQNLLLFFQIVCRNFGPIPGTLIHILKNKDFGSRISVEPSEMKLEVGQTKSMKLSFWSDRSGNTVERVDFKIKESSEIISCIIKYGLIN